MVSIAPAWHCYAPQIVRCVVAEKGCYTTLRDSMNPCLCSARRGGVVPAKRVCCVWTDRLLLRRPMLFKTVKAQVNPTYLGSPYPAMCHYNREDGVVKCQGNNRLRSCHDGWHASFLGFSCYGTFPYHLPVSRWRPARLS